MYDRVKGTEKGAGEQMVCFMVGRENPSLRLHYQIMICIFTVEMNSNKQNVGEICRTKLTSVSLLCAVMAS